MDTHAGCIVDQLHAYICVPTTHKSKKINFFSQTHKIITALRASSRMSASTRKRERIDRKKKSYRYLWWRLSATECKWTWMLTSQLESPMAADILLSLPSLVCCGAHFSADTEAPQTAVTEVWCCQAKRETPKMPIHLMAAVCLLTVCVFKNMRCARLWVRVSLAWAGFPVFLSKNVCT